MEEEEIEEREEEEEEVEDIYLKSDKKKLQEPRPTGIAIGC